MMVPSSPRDVIGQFGPESLHARNVQSSTLFCYKRVRFVFWLSPAIPTTEPMSRISIGFLPLIETRASLGARR
jgi:hypothetical protein